MKVCLIQNCPGINKEQNFEKILSLIPNKQIDILIFPECFNSPYGLDFFKVFAEKLQKGEKTYDFIDELSTKLNETYIIAGSIPELDNNIIYNTSTVWKKGKIIAKYRKNNLFDNKIPNVEFKESDIISPGNTLTIFDTEWGKIGLGICFDLRFNQIANLYSKADCKIIIYPASFTEHTGNLHWSILNRARAIDSQLFVLSCATSTNPNNKFRSYGHSMIVDPWGKILNELGSEDGYIYDEINMNTVNNMREVLPVNQNKKFVI